jgi:hypothetical protein
MLERSSIAASAKSAALPSSPSLLRRRQRACVEGLVLIPQCAEAIFTQSRAAPALVV